jgi:hypothetical protein
MRKSSAQSGLIGTKNMKTTLIELWFVVMRIFWLAVCAAFLIGLLRMCAWADKGIRGESPIITNPNPFASHE